MRIQQTPQAKQKERQKCLKNTISPLHQEMLPCYFFPKSLLKSMPILFSIVLSSLSFESLVIHAMISPNTTSIMKIATPSVPKKFSKVVPNPASHHPADPPKISNIVINETSAIHP